MPYLSVYVDERTMAVLVEVGMRQGRDPEELASAAVAEEAMRSIPPAARAGVYGQREGRR